MFSDSCHSRRGGDAAVGDDLSSLCRRTNQLHIVLTKKISAVYGSHIASRKILDVLKLVNVHKRLRIVII